MKLKNIMRGTICGAIALVAASCSNIDENDRLIYVKPAEVGRAVLIEDYTGQRCVNCPRGTETINSIVEAYGEDNVIAVGIHSGPLGFAGNAKNVGLMTDTGNEYYSHWDSANKIGQPWALFNRNAAPNSDYNTWAAYVASIMAMKAKISLAVANTYDPASRALSCAVEAYGTDGNTTGKLQLWLIEDGITAMQMMPDGSANREYVHNHVFRAAVNGTWGDDIAIKEGESVSKQYTYTIPESWNADNVSVVAFVYNDNGVEQVTKKPILNNTNE